VADRHIGKKQVYILLCALLSIQEMNMLISSSQTLKASCSIPDLICQALLEYNIPFFII